MRYYCSHLSWSPEGIVICSYIAVNSCLAIDLMGAWKVEIDESMTAENLFLVRAKHWTCSTNFQIFFDRN